jgi:flavin reductase (DIM6/NTAB) family NADH-FMN oxidoreductase RutF
MNDDSIKNVLKRMPYGFYAVTSSFEEDSNAMVLNWATQISFDPRLISIAVQKTAYSNELIKQGQAFVLNLFLQENSDSIKNITKSRQKNPQKMENVDFEKSPSLNLPVIKGAAAFLECKLSGVYDTGGDHELFIGEVVGAGELKSGESQDTLNLPDLGWSYAG